MAVTCESARIRSIVEKLISSVERERTSRCRLTEREREFESSDVADDNPIAERAHNRKAPILFSIQ